jgi:hypothetical protein
MQTKGKDVYAAYADAAADAADAADVWDRCFKILDELLPLVETIQLPAVTNAARAC